jgi:hypothetical protein
MRRIFPILILVLLAPLAFAQTVVVTATITGSNTAPYIYGTYQIQLVDASGTQIPSTGLPTSYNGSQLLLTRYVIATDTGYILHLQNGSNFLEADVAGVGHTLLTFSATATAGDTWQFTVVGSTNPILTAYQNGIVVGTVQDTTYGGSIVSGSPGFLLASASGTITDSTITSYSAGTL